MAVPFDYTFKNLTHSTSSTLIEIENQVGLLSRMACTPLEFNHLPAFVIQYAWNA